MDLPSKAVFDVLEANNATKLYHANSVITSCQFIKQRSLLSRGTVETLKLRQSGQYSDEDDKRYSLWFDVFVDSEDIHRRGRMANKYGPVLFVIDVEKLRRIYTGRVWVTKANPTKWAGRTDQQRWFQSKTELQQGFVLGNFDHMIVFRHRGGTLPLDKILDEIIVDNPDREIEGFDAASIGYGALTLAMCESGLIVPISKRVCHAGCTCERYYQANRRRMIEMFNPFIRT